MRGKVVSRWALLAAVVAFSLASVMQVYSQDDDELAVDVRVDTSTLDRALSDFNPPPAGAFYVQGDIFTAGGEAAGEEPIGVFHRWGWRLHMGVGGHMVVSEEYHLFGLGRIELQGRQAPGLTRAVVGGTALFKGVDGEAASTPPVPGGGFARFTTIFDLNRDGHLFIDFPPGQG